MKERTCYLILIPMLAIWAVLMVRLFNQGKYEVVIGNAIPVTLSMGFLAWTYIWARQQRRKFRRKP